jgi:ribonuclease J
MALAERLGRRVLLAGRSLQRNVDLARALGFIKVQYETLIDASELSGLPKEKVLIIATGAQGEPRSALMQMLSTGSRDLRLEPNDLLLMSSRTIPGNAPAVAALIDSALARGAKVLYPAIEPGLHASGHAANDEQRKMIQAVKPRGFIPVHGELKHLHRHLALARAAGVPQTLLATDGDVVGVDTHGLTSLGRVPHGRSAFRREADAAITYEALEERRGIAAAGVVFVCVIINSATGAIVDGPRVVTRGLGLDEAAAVPVATEGARLALAELSAQRLADDEVLVKDALVLGTRRAFKQLTGSRPTVVPVVLKIG